jgi:hypothetical protein
MGFVFALGIVTPVLGGPATDLALERAKKGKKVAKAARDTANQALVAAQQASQLAQRSSDRLDAQQVASAREGGLVTTTAAIGDYESLGGPSVQVTVPPSGLIEVFAQADILNDDGGAVALYEDGQKVPGISEEAYCGDDSALFEMTGGGGGDFETFSTPAQFDVVLGCTNIGAPASVLLERPPGTHTYELRYSECVCGGEAEFQNRILRIAPKP